MNNKPSWVNPIAILGIIFGVFGIFSAGQMTMSPIMIKFQQDMMGNITNMNTGMQEGLNIPDKPLEEMTEEEKALAEMAEEQQEVMDETTQMMTNMLETPDWFNTYCYVLGPIGLLVSGFIILASIFLLMLKKGSPRLFTTACWVGVGYALVKAGAAAAGGMMMMMSFLGGAFFGVVIYAILAIVTINSDKTAFTEDPIS